jgi:hypothetical protein
MLWRLIALAALAYLLAVFGLDSAAALADGDSIGSVLRRVGRRWSLDMGRDLTSHALLLGLLLVLAFAGAWVAKKTRPLFGALVVLVPVLIVMMFATVHYLGREDPRACCARPPVDKEEPR